MGFKLKVGNLLILKDFLILMRLPCGLNYLALFKFSSTYSS